jgi:NADH:ubiquinone oxidoreductase subunit H
MLITYIFFISFLPNYYIVILSLTLFISFLFTWIRVTYCRYRYDMLIMMSWKVLLPLVLIIFICFITLIVI